MKFLLNLHLPRVLGRRLVAAGHPCRHGGDIGLGRASDLEIMAEAGRNPETILTHDLDYGHLLAISGGTAPSVIIFRRRNREPIFWLQGDSSPNRTAVYGPVYAVVCQGKPVRAYLMSIPLWFFLSL